MEQLNTAITADDLLIFAEVAKSGGFSAAAEQLGLPKSTVSRRIAALEVQLGERLLWRTTRRQSLTELGLQLLEHARQVALEVEAVAVLREQRQAAPSGRLRVSMPNDFATLLLSDMLAAFVTLHPAITLELDLSPRRVDLLGEGFDLALRIGNLPDDAWLAARCLTVLSSGLYAAPAYLAEHGEPHSPEQLLQHQAVRLLGNQSLPSVWHLMSAGQEWRGMPPGRVGANSPELLIQLAQAGLGIAAVPDFIAQPLLQQGRLCRVLPTWALPPAQVWAVFPGRKLMPAKTRVFIDMLQAALTGCGALATAI